MNAKERTFVRTVRAFYEKQGRTKLPWRATTQPYRILVSEIMLQQTQVVRVEERYRQFLKTFPTVSSLARAPLGAVLREWQGLGYNRRAKMLHACARTIVDTYNGRFPRAYEALVALPGIGPYTAAAVCAFAFNMPLPLIETNVRSVYLHHFFPHTTQVSDAEILPLIERTLDRDNPREWYWALMDYGAFIKKTYGNPNNRSIHHLVQSPFVGSDRQIRGAILRVLTKRSAMRTALHEVLPFEVDRIDAQLERLSEEGMVIRRGRLYQVPL